MIRRHLLKHGCAALAACLVGGLLSAAPTTASAADQQLSVLLNWAPTVENLPVFIAKELGYFKEQGIDVRIKEGVGSADTAKVVGSGAENIGVSSGVVVPIVREKGIPIISIGIHYQKDPNAIISMKKTGITKPKDLEGKKVGVKFGTSSHQLYEAIIEKHNINRSKIQEVSIGKDVVQLLVSGRIEVAMGYISVEAVQAERLGGPVNLMLMHDLGLPMYGTLYITSEKFAKENPKAVEAFMKAVLKGWDYAIRDPEKAINLFVKIHPLLEGQRDILPAQLKKSLALLVSDDSIKAGLGTQSKRGWDDTQDVLVKLGTMKKRLDSSTFFTNDFIDKAPRVDVKRIKLD